MVRIGAMGNRPGDNFSNPLIAEMLAKRERGTVGKDAPELDDLGLHPPPKARPTGLPVVDGHDDDIFLDDGYEAAIVPYSIQYIPADKLRGTRSAPFDVTEVLAVLWRADDDAYEEASTRQHIVHIPNGFFDDGFAVNLRPFFQVHFFRLR
jgi:hypothetical protein